ncbi:MAG: sigma-70 family RNA polymerase sigma factor [Anaerolineae bacterium]|nr:sigma-70 family RNA polymerase sigma factor [Anaerolineae bacterium]
MHPISNSANTSFPSEAELVAAAKAGHQDAYTAIVERYSGTIYNLALRLTGNPQEAEDVLQETFISAFRALSRFEGRSQLGTWLYRIAYNAALMRLRKRQVPTESLDEPLTTDEGEFVPRQFVDWSRLPDELLLGKELRSTLEAALQTLPVSLRSVFVLRDIEGLSTAETAQALGLTETNVKVRLHRARLALREKLSQYFAPALAVKGKEFGARAV